MKKRKNRSIELDLTSFIDVIFVMLIAFIFIYSQNKVSQPTPAPIVNPLEDVIAIGLIVEYNDDDIEHRDIQLVCNPEMSLAPLSPLEGDNEEPFDMLISQITQVVNEHPDVPVILSMYEDKILYRDHKKIDEMLENLKDKDNFYPSWKRNIVSETAENTPISNNLESIDGQ